MKWAVLQIEKWGHIYESECGILSPIVVALSFENCKI